MQTNRKWSDRKWYAILVQGVLFWGYPAGLIGKSIELSPPRLHLPRFGSVTEVAIFLTTWTIAGVTFGAWMWHPRSTDNRSTDDRSTDDRSTDDQLHEDTAELS